MVINPKPVPFGRNHSPVIRTGSSTLWCTVHIIIRALNHLIKVTDNRRPSLRVSIDKKSGASMYRHIERSGKIKRSNKWGYHLHHLDLECPR